MLTSEKKIEWIQYKNLNLKLICFSKTTFEKVLGLGFEALHLQYFIPPKKIKKDFSQFKVYFWQRHKSVNWSIIKKLLGNQKVDKFLFRNIPDPFIVNLPLPNKEDIRKYNIIFSNKWFNKNELENIMSEYNIFFAPRIYEGIGFSFLEAMAFGMIVIAPNTPTHNEYIKNGINGYLYDPSKPKPIDFKDIEIVGKNVLDTVKQGYQKWIANKNDILEFIEKSIPKYELTSSERRSLRFYWIYNYLKFFERTLKKIIKKLLWFILYRNYKL